MNQSPRSPSPYIITTFSTSPQSLSPTTSPPSSPLLSTKDSIILSRLTQASTSNDDVQGRKKIASLLSRHGTTAAEHNSGTEEVSPLMQAAIKGNIACCEELLLAGSNPNATTNYGWSSVHFAAALGKDRCLSVLLHTGSTVVLDVPDDSGYCPVHLAAMGGHTACIDGLVRAGHSLLVRSLDRATPLHLAAQEGRLFTVHRLCKLNVPVDDSDMSGCTGLTISSRAGNKNIVQVLIDSGADVNHISKTGLTSFSVACEHNRFDIAKTLLQSGAMVRKQDLITAADGGHADLLREIFLHIEIVTDAEAKGIRLRKALGNRSQQMPRLSLSPALHAAIKKGHCATTSTLLAAGAEIDSLVGNDGLQPLHRAIKKNINLETIVILLNYGAAPLAVTKSSKMTTPVLLAADKGRLDIVQCLLLRTSKCLGQQDKAGDTVLLKAVRLNDRTMVKYLLTNSIGTCSKLTKLTNARGNSALHVGARLGHIQCISEMLQDGRVVRSINAMNVNKMTPLHLACQEGNINIVRLLIERKASLNTADHKGASPLLVAVEAGAIDLVSMLLSAGASPCTYKNSGATCLHAAARRGHHDILSLLLTALNTKKNRSNMKNVVNRTMKRCGSSALHLSIKMGHIEAMEALLKWTTTGMVEVDATNADGDTGLMLGVRLGDLGMCRRLMECGADARYRCGAQGSPLMWSERQHDVEMCTVLMWVPPVRKDALGNEIKDDEVEGGDGGGGGGKEEGGGGGGCVLS